MPLGCTSLIPFIAQDLYHRRPGTVLDVGCGNGLYGALVRNYCGDLEPGASRQTHVVGVEGFARYCNPLWDLYDRVVNLPIEEFLSRSSESWDVIILVDVLEHFEAAAGRAVIKELKSRVNPGGVLWVGTPAIWMPQQAVFGNEFERHRSLWTAQELGAAGLQIVMLGDRDIHGNQMLLGRFTPHAEGGPT